MTAEALPRVVGLRGAVLLGLGSIVGTGVFVSLAVAVGIAGDQVLPALVIAALLALCNGLSSAELAARFPVSGGTYEYAHRTLNGHAGFAAGWLFLCAKGASCATAAMGVAGYLTTLAGVDGDWMRKLVALASLALVTTITALGLKRSNQVNALIVSLTLVGLTAFAWMGLAEASTAGGLSGLMHRAVPTSASTTRGVLEAAAVLFVAFTGYGRIATLGEEVRAPERTIPRAVVLTLIATLALYLVVAIAALGSVGPERLASAVAAGGAPLGRIARELGHPLVFALVSIASVTAMFGVQLNLSLGLSRVLLAMSRRREAPARFTRLRGTAATPVDATVAVGVGAAVIVLAADLASSWSFSAFTVLVYYAITNLAALRIQRAERRFPPWISWCGLAACGFLALWIEGRIAAAGAGLLALGFVLRRLVKAP